MEQQQCQQEQPFLSALCPGYLCSSAQPDLGKAPSLLSASVLLSSDMSLSLQPDFFTAPAQKSWEPPASGKQRRGIR